jgi:hypothetical protein
VINHNSASHFVSTVDFRFSILDLTFGLRMARYNVRIDCHGGHEMIRIRCIAAGIAATLLTTGCQAPSTPKIFARLPQPSFLNSGLLSPPPPCVCCDPPEVKAAALPAPPGWQPPAGLSRRWTAIVIHHTASDLGSLADIDAWHREKGWEGCGYHFVIGNGTHSGDGQIEVGPRWTAQTTGAHTRLFGATSSAEGNYYNEHGIGIVLVGNFDRTRPTPRQLDALVGVISYLSRTCNIPLDHVFVHGELKSTDCPGCYFSRTLLRRRLLDALAKSDVTNSLEGG